MQDQLKQLETTFLSALKEITTPEGLKELKNEYLGKNLLP